MSGVIGLVVSWVRGLFTPTGAVVLPMLALLGFMLYPNIDKVMTGLGFETKSSLRAEIDRLKGEKKDLESEKEGMEGEISSLKSTVGKYNKLMLDLARGDTEVDSLLEDFLGQLELDIELDEVGLRGGTSSSFEGPVEELRVDEEKDEVIVEVIGVREIKPVVRSASNESVKVELQSRQNIVTIHNAYEAFFGS